MANNPVTSSSTLGQFRDEVVGELKGVATDTAKQVVSEPKKILESILGTASSKQQSADSDQGIEDLVGGGQGSSGQGSGSSDQASLIKRQIEDQETSQKLIALHRQRLREEEEYFAKRKQEDEAKEQQEEQEEEAEKQEEIVQLQRKSADIQMNRQLQGRLGSKEQGKQSY